MTGILRTWLCLNQRCKTQWNDWDNYPSCPQCGNVRCQWVPGGGNILSGATRDADGEAKALATMFNLSDLNSGRRGEAVKPMARPTAHQERGAPAKTFGPGFVGTVKHDINGSPVATCEPSLARVNFKAKVGVGKQLAHSRTIAAPQSHTAIEARSTGRT